MSKIHHLTLNTQVDSESYPRDDHLSPVCFCFCSKPALAQVGEVFLPIFRSCYYRGSADDVDDGAGKIDSGLCEWGVNVESVCARIFILERFEWSQYWVWKNINIFCKEIHFDCYFRCLDEGHSFCIKMNNTFSTNPVLLWISVFNYCFIIKHSVYFSNFKIPSANPIQIKLISNAAQLSTCKISFSPLCYLSSDKCTHRLCVTPTAPPPEPHKHHNAHAPNERTLMMMARWLVSFSLTFHHVESHLVESRCRWRKEKKVAIKIQLMAQDFIVWWPLMAIFGHFVFCIRSA